MHETKPQANLGRRAVHEALATIRAFAKIAADDDGMIGTPRRAVRIPEED